MRENPLDLTGRIVVVAGASGGGLGSAVTRMAAENGATVIAVSRSQDEWDTHIPCLINCSFRTIFI